MTPELSRIIVPDLVPAAGQTVEIVATKAECAALAIRLRLPAVASVRCTFRLLPGFASVIDATGHLSAKITQTCIVTLEDFSTRIDDRFTLRFVPQGRESFDADPESVDEIPYAPGQIDLGEAAAEQLALILDPYPRRPGLPSEHSDPPARSAFAALAALKFKGPPD